MQSIVLIFHLTLSYNLFLINTFLFSDKYDRRNSKKFENRDRQIQTGSKRYCINFYILIYFVQL